jgi:hypothetical protein
MLPQEEGVEKVSGIDETQDIEKVSQGQRHKGYAIEGI